MNHDNELRKLYKKRDDFYSRLFSQFLAILLSTIVLISFSYLTLKELKIWISGERIDSQIEEIGKFGPDEYFITLKFNGNTLTKELERTSFLYFQNRTTTEIIYWKSNPKMSIFLDLEDKWSIMKLALGIIISGIFLILLIKKTRKSIKEKTGHNIV